MDINYQLPTLYQYPQAIFDAATEVDRLTDEVARQEQYIRTTKDTIMELVKAEVVYEDGEPTTKKKFKNDTERYTERNRRLDLDGVYKQVVEALSNNQMLLRRTTHRLELLRNEFEVRTLKTKIALAKRVTV